MNDVDSQNRESRVSETVSTETAVFAISVVLLFQQHSDLFQSLIRHLLEAPSEALPVDDLKHKIEPALKQAAEVLVAAQVLNGFLRHRTAQTAVTFIYIVFRYLFYSGQTPTRRQSIELWGKVWTTARNFPIVAEEYKQREIDGDPKGWMNEVQTAARRQLRTFKKQLPKIQENTAGIYNRAYNSFLGET
jgi:hypothetical protein